jgi:hypothetical protein
MRPEWHRCLGCYFVLEGKNDGLWCHYDPDPIETIEDSFCSRWICGGCGVSWEEEESHFDCLAIEVDLTLVNLG